MAAVAAVHDELLAAAAQVGEDPGVVFAVGPVEIVFEAELRAAVQAKAGSRCGRSERRPTAAPTTQPPRSAGRP
ncbi:trypco2 family protein [Streptomyces sp. NBC_00233]|uniref:trypco2 family protein n=1 Tax=Streptomyces sp. NBC_00233 TaxID=2975686 RepID=UPI00338DEA3B